MSDLDRAEVLLLTDLVCAGGTVVAHVPLRAGTSITRDIDGQHGLVLTVPTYDQHGIRVPWVRDIARGQVVYTKLPNGKVYEWRVEVVEDGLDADGVTVVTADPVEIDLVNVGPLYTLVGGVPDYALAWVDETAAEVLTRLVIPYLQARGITWVSVGTVDSTTTLTGTGKSLNALQVIDALVSGIRGTGEAAYAHLRRDGDSGYVIDITADPSQAAPQALVSEGLNLRSLHRKRGRDLATAMVVRGPEVEGFRQPLGAGYWTVATVVESAEVTVGLVDPQGGAGPVYRDGTFVANGASGTKAVATHYLRAQDDTYHAITDTTAPGTFVLPNSATGAFAVGDRVMVAPATDGSLLREIISPQVATYDYVGRTLDLDDLGAARGQYQTDPRMVPWTTAPVNDGCVVSAATTDPGAVPVSRLTPDTTYPAGTRVQQIRSADNAFDANGFYTLATAAVSDANGDATLDLDGGPSVDFDGAGSETLLLMGIGHAPDNWTNVQAAGSADHVSVFRRPLTTAALTDLSATLATAASNSRNHPSALHLDGLTEGDTIYAGDILDIPGGDLPAKLVAWEDAVADANGEAWLAVWMPATFNGEWGQVTWPVGEPVTVSRPLFVATGGFCATVMPWPDSYGAYAQVVLDAPLSHVFASAANPKLWASAWLTLRVPTGTYAMTPRAGGVTGHHEAPRVVLRNAAGELAEQFAEGSGDDGSFVLADGEQANFIIRTAFEVTLSGDYGVRVYAPDPNTQASPHGGSAKSGVPVMYLRYAELSLAPTITDTETEPVSGHRANLLHQEAGRQLALRDGWPPEIQVSGTELVRAGMSPAAVRVLGPGQEVRALSPTTGIDAVLIVQRVTYNGDDPRDLTYTLAWRHQTLTERLRGASAGAASAGSSTTRTTTSTGGGGTGGGTAVDAYTKAEVDVLFDQVIQRATVEDLVDAAVRDVRAYGDTLMGTGKQAYGATAAAEAAGGTATDFSQHATGVGPLPSDWADLSDDTVEMDDFGDWEIVADAGAQGGKFLRFTSTDFGPLPILGYDPAGTGVNCDIVMKARSSSSDTGNHIGPNYSLGEQDSGSNTFPNLTPDVTDLWYWARINFDGTTRRERWWLDGDPEPATWDVETEVSHDSGSFGWLGQFFPGETYDVDFFGFSDDANTPAPTTAAAGSPGNEVVIPAGGDAFAAGDVGRTIIIEGVEAGAVVRRTSTITSVLSATKATVGHTYATDMTGGTVYWYDDAQDDAAGIQAAFDDAPAVSFPAGVYVVATAGFTRPPGLRRVYGEGPRRSVILQRSDDSLGDTLDFADADHFTLAGMGFAGPGRDGTHGGRVRFYRDSLTHLRGLVVRDVEVSGVAGSAGLVVDAPLLGRLENITARRVAGEPVVVLDPVSTDIINVGGEDTWTAGLRVTGGQGVGVAGARARLAGVGVLLEGVTGAHVSHLDVDELRDRVPDVPAALTPTAAAGGSVPDGDYRVRYAWVRKLASGYDVVGHVAPSSDPVTLGAGDNTIDATIPAAPAGTTHADIYITPTDGAAGTEGWVEQVAVSTGATTAYSRAATFTPGDAPAAWSWGGHGLLVDDCSHVVVTAPQAADVPDADSRYYLVRRSSRVTLANPGRVHGAATPDYAVEITADCEAVDLVNSDIPLAEVLDAQQVPTTGHSRSVLGDALRRELAARAALGVLA